MLWWCAGLLPSATGPAVAQSNIVIVSTTTSTQDSGLLDVLVPMFEKQTGLTVKTISVGTGQALALAARGEADVTLAHAPSLEKKYVDEGKMANRRLVMYNDFVVIGPPDDPARIKGLPRALDALKRIAESQSRFVSRGDKSGTHASSWSWEAGGHRAEGLLVHRVRTGHGADPRHRQRAARYALTVVRRFSRSRSGWTCRSSWRRTDRC